MIGAVLAAFYTTPFEPARLAGAPVPVRQTFEVGPEAAPQAGPATLPDGRGVFGRQPAAPPPAAPAAAPTP